MVPESEGTNPVGLYRNPTTKAEIGCIHPSQADAVVRQGFVLVREGSEAALTAGQDRTAKAAAPAAVEAAPASEPKEETK